nr:uncharacterized protein LOC109158994 [Ipomoea batatas]
MRVNRTYPTIVGWSAELARKRVREENKAGSFGRGTVLPRISKPADIAAATSGQTDQPPVAALNIPSSSVDKVAGILQKLASTVGEFGEAMAEIGKQGAPVNVMRKTFSGLSNMLNVASTIEATATPTSSQLDDIFFGSESFTTDVDALDINDTVLRHGHYFLICINVKASKLEIIDNKSLVSGVTMKDKYGDCTTLLVTALKEYLALGSSALFWKVDELTEEVVDMSWKESENYIDCGLFVMRHMETYKGTLKKWNPGFKKKAKLNEEFLIGLRARSRLWICDVLAVWGLCQAALTELRSSRSSPSLFYIFLWWEAGAFTHSIVAFLLYGRVNIRRLTVQLESHITLRFFILENILSYAHVSLDVQRLVGL